jgi:DNA-binding response OmpR family regulator
MEALFYCEHADEAAVLNVILQQVGFTVRSVRTMAEATEAWPERPADLVMLALPEETKFDHLPVQVSQIRAQTLSPIVVVADFAGSESQQVNVLEAGADMIVCRPYGARLLVAELRALLRRSAGVPFFSLPTLTQSDVVLDPSNRTVMVGEDVEPRRLTQLEFRLLYTLMVHTGQVLPTENLVEMVWGYTGDGNRELVRGLVQRLRTKVEPDPSEPRYIMTEANIGYYFNRFSVENASVSGPTPV